MTSSTYSQSPYRTFSSGASASGASSPAAARTPGPQPNAPFEITSQPFAARVIVDIVNAEYPRYEKANPELRYKFREAIEIDVARGIGVPKRQVHIVRLRSSGGHVVSAELDVDLASEEDMDEVSFVARSKVHDGQFQIPQVKECYRRDLGGNPVQTYVRDVQVGIPGQMHQRSHSGNSGGAPPNRRDDPMERSLSTAGELEDEYRITTVSAYRHGKGATRGPMLYEEGGFYAGGGAGGGDPHFHSHPHHHHHGHDYHDPSIPRVVRNYIPHIIQQSAQAGVGEVPYNPYASFTSSAPSSRAPSTYYRRPVYGSSNVIGRGPSPMPLEPTPPVRRGVTYSNAPLGYGGVGLGSVVDGAAASRADIQPEVPNQTPREQSWGTFASPAKQPPTPSPSKRTQYALSPLSY